MRANRQPPLDDVLDTARACARVVVGIRARDLYRKLMADVAEASEGWPQTEAGKAALLDAYREEYRKALCLPPMRRRRRR